MCSFARLRTVIVVALIASLSICCGGSSDTTAPIIPSPPAPVISNFTATFGPQNCTREFPGNRGVTGTTLSLVFTYSAQGASLQGGHVQLFRSYNTGDSEPHS